MKKWMIISLVINVFLTAFILGRWSMPMIPPFAMMGKMMPPPPPLMWPLELFEPQELMGFMSEVQGDFEKMAASRHAFGKTLSERPVSKEEVLTHFDEMGAVMDAIKDRLQEKGAEKISTLSNKERLEFAKKLEH